MTQKGPIQLYNYQADLIWPEDHIQVVITVYQKNSGPLFPGPEDKRKSSRR